MTLNKVYLLLILQQCKTICLRHRDIQYFPKLQYCFHKSVYVKSGD